MSAEQARKRWHAALAYALLGPPARDLPEAGIPSPAVLIGDLGGRDEVRRAVTAARQSGPWPYQVPVDLRTDLGAAQFAAAWTALLAELGPLMSSPPPVVADRALTADERRLLADRPPHHGG